MTNSLFLNTLFHQEQASYLGTVHNIIIIQELLTEAYYMRYFTSKCKTLSNIVGFSILNGIFLF